MCLLLQLFEYGRIFPEDLYGDVCLDAADNFVEPHRHWLREVVRDAGNSFQARRNLLDELLFGVRRCPLLPGFKRTYTSASYMPIASVARSGRPELGYYATYLGKLYYGSSRWPSDLYGFGKRDSG